MRNGNNIYPAVRSWLTWVTSTFFFLLFLIVIVQRAGLAVIHHTVSDTPQLLRIRYKILPRRTLPKSQRNSIRSTAPHFSCVESTLPISCKLLLYSYGMGLGLRLYLTLKTRLIQKWHKLRWVASSATAVKMPTLSFVRQVYNMSVLVQYFSWYTVPMCHCCSHLCFVTEYIPPVAEIEQAGEAGTIPLGFKPIAAYC